MDIDLRSWNLPSVNSNSRFECQLDQLTNHGTPKSFGCLDYFEGVSYYNFNKSVFKNHTNLYLVEINYLSFIKLSSGHNIELPIRYILLCLWSLYSNIWRCFLPWKLSVAIFRMIDVAQMYLICIKHYMFIFRNVTRYSYGTATKNKEKQDYLWKFI